MSAEILPLIDFSKVKKKRRIEDQANDNDEDLGDVLIKKTKGKKKGKKKSEKTDNSLQDKENEEFNNTNGLYSYEFLLNRVYEKMKDITLNDIKLPQIKVIQSSNGKSSWVNFQELVDALGRGREHLFQYFKDDFGIEASLGQNGEILFKKKVTDIMVKNTLRKYLDNYVKCPVCKSFNTILKKDQRLLRIFCLDCKGERTIQPLKSRGVPEAGKKKKINNL